MSDPVFEAPAMQGAQPTGQRIPLLSLENVSRTFEQGPQRLDVFQNISLQIFPGEMVALVGPSGSGKSSLLHICGLLEPPSAGEVFLSGRAAGRLDDDGRTRMRRDEIGFVYQFHQLLPEFSALENVILPQMVAGQAMAEAETVAIRLLTMVGLKERLHHRPARLSGGEQQRVAIARALANRPKVLLADEPTGNLDQKTAGLVFQVLLESCRGRNVSALVATHNIQMAARMDRTLLLHEGRLIDAGKLRE